MNFGQIIRAAVPGATEARSFPPTWYANALDTLRYGGHSYWLAGNQSYGPNEAPVALTGEAAYCQNGVVFAVEQRRIELFKQARFAFKRYGAGPKPMSADLFRDSALRPLDNPAQILARMLLDADTMGNSYQVMWRDKVRRLNPGWCTIVLGSELEPDDPDVAWDAEPIGLIYKPPTKPDKGEVFTWDQVAHFAPIMDPQARFRGMSWMSPVLSEVSNTNAYNRYISKYWENNATPNTVVTFDPEKDVTEIEEFRDLFLEKQAGVERSFRTAFLGGGADLKIVGSNLKDLAAKEITSDQFAKICAAGGVPPIVVTIVPGLESASTYANYATAHRAFADLTMRPLWLDAVRALSKIVSAPAGSELWYDTSGVSALQADALDDAEVQNKQAATMRMLWDGGAVPESVIDSVTSFDWSKLQHSGLLSVQTQAPGSGNQGGGPGG